MIDRNLQSVEWSAFMYGLEDAREHLDNLVKDIEKDPAYGEPELRVDLGKCSRI